MSRASRPLLRPRTAQWASLKAKASRRSAASSFVWKRSPSAGSSQCAGGIAATAAAKSSAASGASHRGGGRRSASAALSLLWAAIVQSNLTNYDPLTLHRTIAVSQTAAASKGRCGGSVGAASRPKWRCDTPISGVSTSTPNYYDDILIGEHHDWLRHLGIASGQRSRRACPEES